MFSPNELKRIYYPGEEWVYLKLYMGPETAEEWICHHLPFIRAAIQNEIKGSFLFYVRYLDPDFHIRLRVSIPQRKFFARVIELVNLHSGILMKQGLIWKSEICTYEREIERYSPQRITFFEQAFAIDTEFWLKLLPWIRNQDDHENLRWKMALLSTFRYYRDLIKDPNEMIIIKSKIVESLKQEQRPGRTVMFQIDQKFRHLRTDLEPFMEEELHLFPQVEKLLRIRAFKLAELFEPLREGENYFAWAKADQDFANLVHMSLNRVLRSKHRMQEFVIYYYLVKLLKSQLVLR